MVMLSTRSAKIGAVQPHTTAMIEYRDTQYRQPHARLQVDLVVCRLGRGEMPVCLPVTTL
jgi:hypothetical protein